MRQDPTDVRERGPRAKLLDRYHLARPQTDEFASSLCQMLAGFWNADIAYVSVIDDIEQSLRACVGIQPYSTAREETICNLTIQSVDPLVILDTTADPKVNRLPFVTAEQGVRFYAGMPLVTSTGEVLGALCVADRKAWPRFPRKHLEQLKLSARLLMQHYETRRASFPAATAVSFINVTELSMISVDRTGTIQFVNNSLLKLLGYTRDEIIGRNVSVIVPQRFRASHDHGFDKLSTAQGPLLDGKTVEVFARHRDGSEIPVEITLSAWTDENGLGIGAVINDISERRARDTRLLRLANHDPVTGFNTRHRWEELLEEHVSTRRAGTIFLIELDGLKETGERLGQDVFDTLIQNIAVRLPRVLSRECMIARFSEEQIGILNPAAQTGEDIAALATAILDEILVPYDIGHTRVKIGAAIGYTRRDDVTDAREWLANADFALGHAKRSGGNSISAYEGPVAQAARQRRVARDELLEALNKQQFVLHYQPQVLLETGELSGLEALLRWEHPERGLIMPGQFLPALEQSAISLDVGAWVLNEATRQLGEWVSKGLAPIKMGMNLFPSQMRGSDLPAEMSQLSSRYGIDPKWLELEITETATLEDEERAFELISELRELGIGIAFDDFGTGYASLGSLQRYPITTLKIDRSFVRDLMTRQRDASITRALIMLSHDLGLNTIAEGVETLEQQIALRLMGCDHGQGYLYGKALPAAEVEIMLAGRLPRKRSRSVR